MKLVSLFRGNKKRKLIDDLAMQDRIKVQACPVCNSVESQPLWTTNITKVTTVICKNCSTCYNDDTLSVDDLELVGKHGGSLVSGLKMDVSACEKYFNKQEKRYQHVLELLNAHQITVKGKRSLDLICEVGGGIKALSDAGSDAEGMDLASDMWRFAAEEKGLSILNCHILDHHPDSKYDFISGVRFINHFNDPVAILGHVNHLLNDDGILYLETFDLIEALQRKSIEECVKIDHPVSFTASNIGRILNLLGFETLFSSTDISNPAEIDFGSLNHSHLLMQKVKNADIAAAKKELSEGKLGTELIMETLAALATFQLNTHAPNFK